MTFKDVLFLWFPCLSHKPKLFHILLRFLNKFLSYKVLVMIDLKISGWGISHIFGHCIPALTNFLEMKGTEALPPGSCGMLIFETLKCNLSPSWENGDRDATLVEVHLVLWSGVHILSYHTLSFLVYTFLSWTRSSIFYIFPFYKKGNDYKTKLLWF